MQQNKHTYNASTLHGIDVSVYIKYGQIQKKREIEIERQSEIGIENCNVHKLKYAKHHAIEISSSQQSHSFSVTLEYVLSHR